MLCVARPWQRRRFDKNRFGCNSASGEGAPQASSASACGSGFNFCSAWTVAQFAQELPVATGAGSTSAPGFHHGLGLDYRLG